MAAELRITLFGSLTLICDGHPLSDSSWRSRPERRLLGILLSTRGIRVPSERLIAWLWPDADKDAAAITLRSAISSLRRTLEPDSGTRASARYIVTHSGGYAWNVESDAWIDVDMFLVSLRGLGVDAHAPAIDTMLGLEQIEAGLRRAIELYRGDYLEDEPDAPWAVEQRGLLRERFLNALQALAERRLAAADYALALSLAQRGLMFDSLCEPLQRIVMRARARAGDPAAALRGYEIYRRALDAELAAVPSLATRMLHAAILRGEELSAANGQAQLAVANLSLPSLKRTQATVSFGRGNGLSMSTVSITSYVTSGGARIYSIPVHVFPMLVANVYIVIIEDYVALIDVGSGIGDCDEQLAAGLQAVCDQWGERVSWKDIQRIVVTHAHIDHHGGLDFVRERTSAPIAIHELDRRIVTNYEERLVLASRELASFLAHAGLSEAGRAKLMRMYNWSKGLFHSVEVETSCRDGDLLDDHFLVYHTPGHCPGLICLQLDDVLLCSDQVLLRTLPHLAPERITPWTGLEHYRQSLRKIAAIPGVRLALGGHEGPIEDLYSCIARIEDVHQRGLERLIDACAEPRTIKELTRVIYPDVQDYDVLLALTKIGAYVEHLDLRGELEIANLDAVTRNAQTAPRYRRIG